MVTTPARSESPEVPSPRKLAGPTALLRVALSRRYPPYRALARYLAALARQSGAIALRAAMLLAWIAQQDLTELGYSSFGAFVAEHVDWSASWERGLRRLVGSPLDKVKAAFCEGLISVRVAVRAPGRVAIQEQEAWLAEQILGPTRDAHDGRPALQWVDGERAATIRRGRRLARLLLGISASNEEVDDRILQWERERVPSEVLLAMAHAPREAPPKVTLDWDWCAHHDPAEALLGRWVEPDSLAEAVERLEVVQGLQRTRRALLAHGWALFHQRRGWEKLGFGSATAFAKHFLDFSPSTARRYRQLGQSLEWFPEVRRAVERWMKLQCAEALIPVIDGASDSRWLALVRRVGLRELRRAVRSARDHGAEKTLRAYEAATALADAWDAARGADAGEDRSSAGAHASSESSPPASDRPGLRVAIPMREPPAWSLRRGLWAPEGLYEAARSLLERVKIPTQRGFGRVKERDRYRCQNPECGRIGLRSHAHHERPRSEGGSDDLSNGITLCPSCHLRLVHALSFGGGPRLVVRSVDVGGLPALLWTWSDGRRVLQFRRWPPPLPASRRGRSPD